MDKLFENNKILILFLAFYYIFMSDKPKNDNQKIIVIYFFSFLMGLFNIIDIKLLLIIYVINFFIYFEYLIGDEFKLKIINKLHYKIFDFIYLLFFKYHFALFVLSMFFTSDKCFFIVNKFINYIDIIDLSHYISYILDFIGVLLILFVVNLISNNPFKLRSFDKIKEKIDEFESFGNFHVISNKKRNILLRIEDGSYFDRENKYTTLCWSYLSYYFWHITDIKNIIKYRSKRKHGIRDYIRVAKTIIRNIVEQIKMIIKAPKRLIRGHSTIEMQTYRQIALETGYYKTLKRKVAEFFYTPMLFSSYKELLKSNYTKVSNEHYKEYIMSWYLDVAPIFYGKKQYKNIKEFWGKEWYKLTDGEFYLSVLLFSKNIDTSTPYIVLQDIYFDIDSYLSEEEYNKIQKNIKKRLKIKK